MENRTIADVHVERIEKYGTKDNTFEDFAIGDKVLIITPYTDSYFFAEGITGVVSRNSGSYLGICVTFDKARVFEDGHIQISFNFNPKDLCNLTKKEYKKCDCCSGTGKVKTEG